MEKNTSCQYIRMGMIQLPNSISADLINTVLNFFPRIDHVFLYRFGNITVRLNGTVNRSDWRTKVAHIKIMSLSIYGVFKETDKKIHSICI